LPRAHRKSLIAVQVAFALLVAWFAGRAIQRQWAAIEDAQLAIDPRWSWVLLSSAIVLAMYLVLVEVWVVQLRAWGQRLTFLPAARIWFIANLGKYIPGKVAGLGTMAVLSERCGVSPLAAIGSSILATLIGIASGVAVVMVTGVRVVDVVVHGTGASVPRWILAAAVAIAIGSLVLAPIVLPRAAGLVARLSGRETILPSLPASTVWLVAASSALAWSVYGVAFQLFAIGMLGRNAGGPSGYIAVYTASYLAGLLSLIPGGFVVREAALVLGLSALNLATAPEAAMLALTSRIWLSILEILPGVVFMLIRTDRRALEQGTPSNFSR
jgi:uncharacterized membrane protein YbhN (UPF0104 family)